MPHQYPALLEQVCGTHHLSQVDDCSFELIIWGLMVLFSSGIVILYTDMMKT